MKVGDKVIVNLTRNNLFSFQTSPQIQCEIIYAPTYDGDTYTLIYCEQVFTLNTNCIEFVGMELQEK